jgi:hypothetical protein
MSVVRAGCDGRSIRLITLMSFCACTAAIATPMSAQIVRLAPIAPPVELVDPSERISGNATAGLVFVRDGDRIGSERLWAYLSDPVADKLKLRISSIDGRYYAEVDYAAAAHARGWVALDLSLREFSFLETNYADPLSEIAAVLSDAETARLYPVRWGAPHRASTVVPPERPRDDDSLRLYVNTERAQAFVVVDEAPAYCRNASAVSAFKFNAICDVKLGDLRAGAASAGVNVIDRIEVFRRAGVRALAPLALDVPIRY